MATTTLTVDGMSCNHCVRSVPMALDAVEGITVGEVGIGKVSLDIPPGSNRIGDVTAAIENAGYHVTAVQS